MPHDDDTPIACTLSGADFEERLAWIARLNADGLRTHRREGAALHLQYDVTVRDRVHELVRRESACCAFLGFAVDERADAIAVTITVPERARDAADQLLEPFLPPPGRSSSAAAVTTAIGVVACAACCLPFVAPAAAVAAAGGALALGIVWLRASTSRG